jgi:peroxiredoxin
MFITARSRVALIGCVSLAASLLVPCAARAEPKPVSVDQLSFKTDAGKAVPWKDVAGAKATVVVFLSFDCPMSVSYLKPLGDLSKAYRDKGVNLIALCPCDDSAAQIAKQAKEYDLPFRVFRDNDFAVTQAMGATVTPQVFVLDAKGEVLYAGLIDDGYSKRLVQNRTSSQHYLHDAIDAILAGKSPTTAKTDPIGCRIIQTPKRGTSLEVTYRRDVQPIIQNRCQSCHRPGEVGPFSLMTYMSAVHWSDDIKEFTQNRKMPPWKPTGGKEFQLERRLTDKELQTIAKWVDNGCPEGDPKDAPPPKKFTKGWYLGEPDLVLTVPEEFVLGPTGPDQFRVFVIPTGLKEDKYVVAFEVRPGNPKIVHHTLNFFDATGNARKLEKEAQDKLKANPPGPNAVDVGPGFSSSMGIGFRPSAADLAKSKPPIGALGGWAPGILPKYLPEGIGYPLPASSDFVIQVHYHRDGRLEKDRTQVGLYFAKKPIEKSMLGLVVPGRFKPDPTFKGRFAAMGYIPAGDEHFVAHGALIAMEDCTMYTVMPHMHLLGKSVKITMTPPDGKAETLIEVADWDYNWQEQFLLKTPIKVKSGTRFDIEAVYDNSSKNPLNPSNPPVDVRFGEQTTNEMLFGFLGATKDHAGLISSVILQRPVTTQEPPKR